jgi:hypothetical protein
MIRKLVMSVTACALVSSAAVLADDKAAPPVAPDAQPDATVNLTGGSVAAGIGYVWGHGKLTFQDKVHPFSLSGVSVVDVGASNISATGKVYNLKNLADFAGNYVDASAGITIAGGGAVAYLKNEHGVVIKLQATTAGLRFTLAAEGVNIKLKS